MKEFITSFGGAEQREGEKKCKATHKELRVNREEEQRDEGREDSSEAFIILSGRAMGQKALW